MKSLLFFLCAFTSCIFSHAQESSNYFNTVAGDSAISFNKTLLKEDLGDTAIIKLSKGLYRIVFNQGINVPDDLDIRIIDEQNQKIEIDKNDGYVDFFNSSTNNLSFITTANKASEDDILGKIFWVYNKNVKRDAPQFNLKDIDGKEYSKESLKGKIVVMNFWGIWCGPCRREIPQLNKLVKQYEDRQDIVFLAVSSDPVDKLMDFIQDTEFNYRLISEKNATDLSTEIIDLGMIAFPSHAVLDRNGNVVLQYLGEHPAIEQMLSSCIERQK